LHIKWHQKKLLFNEFLSSVGSTWFTGVFFDLFAILYDMASRRLCVVEEIVSILNVSNDNISYVCSSGSDCEMFDADSSESESGTSNNGSETLVTHVNSNWLQVTYCDPGPNTSISVQNIECKAVVPSSFWEGLMLIFD
jgi:hypothetical protein